MAMMLKSRCFAAAVVVGLGAASIAGSASAQSNRWSGAYGGIHGGYAFAAHGDTIGIRNFATDAFVDNYGTLRPNGGFGGAQIGYNIVNNGYLFGLEGDFGAGRITATTSATASGITAVSKGQLNSLGTLRARVGWATSPSAIVYATGGLAFGHYDYSIAYSGALNGTLSRSDVTFGWAVGAGTEWALNSNWSLKAEYLLLGLMPARTVNDGTISTIEHLSAHTLKLGLNYKF